MVGEREAAVEDTGDREASEGLTCPRDRVATRLRCTDCQSPICPSCYVRTPVGFKCDLCAAPVPSTAARAGRARRWQLAVSVAVVVILVAAGAWALFGRAGGGESADDGDLGIARDTEREAATVGTGRALDGRSWALQAHRDERGRICSRLTLTGAGSSRESCDAPPGGRPFGPVRSRGSVRGDQTTFQSWGLVSERTAAVRATTEDGTTSDAELFGGEAGLGVKFFMSYVDRLGVVTFVALGANGEELGRVDPPPIPPPGRR